MKQIQNRTEALLKAIENWLSDDNEHLLQAVHQTVEEGYFNFSDVQFALKALRQSLTQEALETWIDRSEISDQKDVPPKNVLCLHAGNLPLVGFQDALAVLLSGAKYTGKISRNDPYLLPTFLNEVKKTQAWGSTDVQWSHRLDDFEDMAHDAMLFAGSEQSVPAVKSAIAELNLKKDDTQFLIRTAHFSLVYFDRKDQADLRNLTEAIFRYGGQGCRSVAVVVSPFSLDSLKDQLKKTAASFWEDNPQQKKPKPKLQQRFAYNEAINRDQLWLGNFLIQQGGVELDQDFICYWVEGDETTAMKWAGRFGNKLQSVYITEADSLAVKVDAKIATEPLATAQQPPIYWQPDGVDPLQWLYRRLYV